MIYERRKVGKADVDRMMQFVLMLKEGDTYIAFCPLLDESSEGDTPEAAQHALREAIRLRLQDKNLPFPRIKVLGIVAQSQSLFISNRGVVNTENKADVLS